MSLERKLSMRDVIEFIISLVIMILAIVGSASRKARQAKQAAMRKRMEDIGNSPMDNIPDLEEVSRKPKDDYLEPMARMQAEKNKRYGNIAPKSQIETILIEPEEDSEPVRLDLDNMETLKKAILYKEILDPKFDH